MSRQAQSDDYYEAHADDLTAWFKVADHDYLRLIEELDFRSLLAKPGVRVLDMGCGTGRFPCLLRPHLNPDAWIEYDYLDPVAVCLDETKRILLPPYAPGRAHQTTLEKFEVPEGGYDVVWSIHAMYAIPRDDLAAALKVFTDSIAKDGTGLIFCQGEAAFYTTLYEAYHGDAKPPFVTAEEVMTVLGRNGAKFEGRPIEFTHEVPDDVLLTYLSKNVFEDQPMEKWLARPELKAIIDANATDDGHAFEQTVWLIRIEG